MRCQTSESRSTGAIMIALALVTAASPAAAQSSQSEAGPTPSATRPVTATLTYSADILADVSGGERPGIMYDGRLGLILEADLGRSIGWSGATAHVSFHAIHGSGTNGDRVGNLLTVSGLEARPALRLFNLWVEQRIGSSGSFRLGQFTAAQEFMISPTANLFVNSTFGWPAAFAADLPSGGPSYPLAAPGARVAFDLPRRSSFLAAIFAGDPAGPGDRDPQVRDRWGLNGFRFAGGAMAIAELQIGLGADSRLKLGGWLHSGSFSKSCGPAAGTCPVRGNAAAYIIADFKIRTASGKAINLFGRATAAPADRNPVSAYLDAGASLQGVLRGRPEDVLGVAAALASLPRSSSAQLKTESVLELSYLVQLPHGASIQPDLQYIWRRSQDGETSPHPRHALVAGLRFQFHL